MKRSLTTFFLCIITCMSLFAGFASAKEKWQSLFDGKTLNGWIQRGGKAKYTAEDGAIVGTSVNNTPNSFLCTKKMYSDFILEIDFKVDPKLNSGVQIRSNSLKEYKNGRVHGYQVEIDPSPRAWTAGIYDEGRRGWLYPLKSKKDEPARKAFKQGQWNHFRVQAIGDSFKTWLNGVPAANLKDSMTSTGFIALQVHGHKGNGLQVKWKNIRIQVLTQKHPSLKALIIDGQNNHNWKATTPIIREILEDTGFIKVDVATTPKNMAEFKPDFSKYDVIVSNYNGASWPEETKKAFVSYMKNGGGFVSIHAADNSFSNWKEYNEMIGLGGWGGRNEKSGPYVYLKDGKIVYDNSPGSGGTHGAQRAYLVKTREPNHPIMRGIPAQWLHKPDELYCKLRGPGKNMTILATAFSKVSKREEPILFTIRYGKGRIFHTVLGHAVSQVKCMGFAFTLQRGTEWAATGKVTLTKIPGNFPTANHTSDFLSSTAFKSIKSYDFGKSRADIAAIEETLRGASPQFSKQIEAKLLNALRAPETKYAGKQYVLKILRRIGSEQCVEPVAALLTDKKLSHMARFTLQRLHAPGVTAALLKALKEVKGDLKIGMISSLADRKDRSIVPKIEDYLASDDKTLVATTIKALGKLGGEKAVKSLQQADVPRELNNLRNNSLLQCADTMLAEGRKDQAVKIYKEISELKSNPPVIRVGGYHGLLMAEKEDAIPMAIELLSSRNRLFRNAGARFITMVRGSAATKKIAEELPKLKPELQLLVITVLVNRKDKTAYTGILNAVENGNKEIKTAALRAMGILGNASSVSLLAKLALEEGETGPIAFKSMTMLSGKGTSKAIARTLKDKNSLIRANGIRAIVIRHDMDSLPALVKAATDPVPQVRKAACNALGTMAGLKELNKIVKLLVKSKSGDDMANLAQALTAIIKRLEDKNPPSRIIAEAIENAGRSAKIQLLNIISNMSTEISLAVARKALKSDDMDIVEIALKALSNWDNPAPLADLKKLALKKDFPLKDAAMKGFIRLLSQPTNRPCYETIGLFKDALKIIRKPENKKLLISAIPRFPCKEGLELAKAMTKVPGLEDVAKAASGKIKGLLMNGRLSATASHNQGETRKAFDNDISSRWSTNTPMKPGMWFMIDLGYEQEVKKITLDTRNSPGDYPRGSEVYASFDGKHFGKPVLKCKPQGPITVYEFKKPLHGRFIKIVQTGEVQGLFWSIHNIKIELAE